MRPRQRWRFVVGGVVVDYLVFEFMGLAMLGLCVVVMMVPSACRQPSSQRSRR
jgi:hypothetical protein